MATEPMSTLTIAGKTFEITDAEARANIASANQNIAKINTQLQTASQSIAKNDAAITAANQKIAQIQASAIDKAGALNIAYPVGSVCITSTNTNPGSSIGGTWTLIDKQYKAQTFSSGVFTPNSAVISAVGGQAARLSGTSIQIRLLLTNAVALTDTSAVLGQINLSAIGAKDTWSNFFVGYCDGGNAVLMCDASGTGEVDCHDIIGKATSLAAGNGGIRLEWTYYITMASRLDAFCDKFYWKRTA